MKEKMVKVTEYIALIVGAYVVYKFPGWINMNPIWLKFYYVGVFVISGIGIYFLMKRYPTDKEEEK